MYVRRRHALVATSQHCVSELYNSRSSSTNVKSHLFNLPDDVLQMLIDTYIPIQSVIMLSSVNTVLYRRLQGDEMWHRIFLNHWGSEIAADIYTVIGFGSFVATLSSSWTLLWTSVECGFTGHDFDSASTLHQNRVVIAAVRSPWKLACVFRHRGVSIMRCRICNKVGALTSVMRSIEEIPTQTGCVEWVAPCRCPELVHRECIEPLLKDELVNLFHNVFISGFREGIILDSTCWLPLDIPVVHWWNEYSTHAEIDNGIGKCSVCNSKFRIGWRLPKNFAELLPVTLADPRVWVRIWRIISSASLVTILISVLETLHQGYKVFIWPHPFLIWWIFLLSLLFHVLLSSRLSRVIYHMWRSHSRKMLRFYLHAYAYFIISALMFVICYTPIPSGILSMFNISDTFKVPYVLVLISNLNAVIYSIMSLVVVYIFWSTHYVSLTVCSDNSASIHPILAGIESHST